MSNPRPIFFTTDHGIVVQGLNTPGTMFLSTNNANSGTINRTQGIYIMPTFDCVLFAANNSTNGGINTNLQLYSGDGTTLIGSGNSINTFTNIGGLVAFTPYLVNITFGATITLSNTFFTEMYFAETLNTTAFFAAGIETSPSLPSGVTVSEQLYGNKYFNFGGFTTVAGTQYTLCFADVALQSGTLNVVLSNFGAGNIFTAYTQSFVSNNSLIVVLTANTSATCPANAQVQVTITNVGTTVRQMIAPVLNAAVFPISAIQAVQFSSMMAMQEKIESVRSLRAIKSAVVLPTIVELNEIKRESISMEEEVQSYEPQQKHQRIY